MNNPESVPGVLNCELASYSRLHFLANAMFTYHDEQELHAASRARPARNCRRAGRRRGASSAAVGCGGRVETRTRHARAPPARPSVQRRRTASAIHARPAARGPGDRAPSQSLPQHSYIRTSAHFIDHTTWNTSIAMIFSRSLTSGLSGMYGWKDSERPFQAPGP
jgi:hypothetical protein